MIGIWNHHQAEQLTYFGLHALQHRGQDGAGIAVNDDGTFKHYRGTGLLSQVFQDKSHLKKLKANHSVGKIHYTLNGKMNDLENVGPLVFNFLDENMAVAQSGNLINGQSLRRELEEEGAVFSSHSDAEILVHLIRRNKETTFERQLEASLKRLKGGFNFIILTRDALYGIVDPNCFRPLSFGRIEETNTTVLASETCAIDALGATFTGNIHAGKYLVVTDDGMQMKEYEMNTQIALEAMEYVYFARPDSEFAGINVHSARKNLGKKLAVEQPCVQADMVIGVPNSSLSAATGFAEQSGLPYEMGLVKNQYVGRTFIEPTKELREQGVRKKISAVRGVVEGKSIVLVDDSIVRGTTSKRLIHILKAAGAREVHLRITSPPICFPNFYGVDMSTTNELIAANYTQAEMKEVFDCESLGFLSVAGLVEGIGTHFDAPHNGLSLSIFDGYYAAGLGENEAEFQANLTPIQKQLLRESNHV